MALHAVCRLDELREGQGRTVRLDVLPDRYLAVFLVEGAIRCIDNECPHVGSPLSRGTVTEGRVVCPSHGWTFDLATGDLCTVFGRQSGVRTYPVAVRDGIVYVDLL